MADSDIENIYERAEKKFKDLDQQIGWLSSFDEKKGTYADNAVKVAEDLQKGFEIIEEAKASRSVDELDSLSPEAKGLKFNKDEAIDTISGRIKDVLFEEITTSTNIKELEGIGIRNIQGLKKEKDRRLGYLESVERATVRVELIKDVVNTRNVSESEAERIVIREKLVTKELGEPKYI